MSEMKPFAKCTPESAGIPSQAIENYLRAIEKQDIYMHSLMIVRGGKCLHESYWKPIDEHFMHRLYSCSKSFVAVAVGICIEQGYFSLDSKAIDFFPEYIKGDEHEYLRMMTVRDLLKMASCWTKGANYSPDDKDWVQTFFDDEVSHVPGTAFYYCTSGTTMLCAIIKRATGKDFMEILRPVFDKIGVSKDAFCVQAPVGEKGHIEWGGSGVVMTMRDFAKFANLVMHLGECDGEYILPFDYIAEATSFQIDNGFMGNGADECCGYGYQFWMMSHGAFAFLGMGGQYALCMPDKDLLLVTTGYEELRKTERKEIFNAFWREVWPYVSDEPLPENKAAQESLAAFSDGLKMAWAKGEMHAEIEKEIHKKLFVMDEGNVMGLKKMRFTFRGESVIWEYENETGEHALTIGLCENVEQPFPERYCDIKIDQKMKRGYRSFVSGAWTSKDTLSMQVEIADMYLGELLMKFVFKGDTVTLFGTKHAEWFMNEFEGFASGKIKE